MGLLPVSHGQAAPLFHEDLQGDLSQWAGNNSGQIVDDPKDLGGYAGNKALSFSQIIQGGDIFTYPIDLASGKTYRIEFDYLGLKGADTESGGYAGIFDGGDGLPFGFDPSHGWYAGAGFTADWPNSLLLSDDENWNHYVYQFDIPIRSANP